MSVLRGCRVGRWGTAHDALYSNAKTARLYVVIPVMGVLRVMSILLPGLVTLLIR